MYKVHISKESLLLVIFSGTIPSIRSCPSWCKSTIGGSVFVFGGYDGVHRMNDFFECKLDTYTVII